MVKSAGLIEAIDNLRMELVGAGNYTYPWIKNGPVENVLAFNNNETIQLIVDPDPTKWHFSSGGILTDLHHNEIDGSQVLTTFPVQPQDFAATANWPNAQKEPWNGPPVDDTNVTGNGYSKQSYFFNGSPGVLGPDSFVTVGPSLPKISPAKGGGAQFWVGSIGVIAQGTGKYKNVHGMSVYIGSAFLEEWPDAQDARTDILTKGFSARVGTYFKFVQLP